MTLAEIVEEIYEGLGNPSDLEYLDPDDGTVDTASAGWLKMVRAVNEGQLALATWKLANGRQVKLRLNEDYGAVVTSSEVQTLVSLTGNVAVFSDAVEPGLLVVGQTSGAKGIIAYADDDEGTLVKMEGTFTAGESVKLYSREFEFPESMVTKKPIELLEVADATGNALSLVKQENGMMAPTSMDLSTPTAWKRLRNGLRFDVYPTDGLEFFVRYVRGPIVLSAVGDEPELPPQLHRGLVLYGMWWGLRRMQESSDAYSVKRDLDDFMARTRIEDDFIVSGQVKIYPEGY